MIEDVGLESRSRRRRSRCGSVGLTKHFGSGEQRVQALRGIDWDVYTGQMTLIVGPSGCGKTTLLSVIAGILDGDSGTVSIFGNETTTMSDRALTQVSRQEHWVRVPAIQPLARAHGRGKRGDSRW